MNAPSPTLAQEAISAVLGGRINRRTLAFFGCQVRFGSTGKRRTPPGEHRPH